MIDISAIAAGVVSGMATQKSIEIIDRLSGKASKEDIIIMLLARLIQIQEPQESWNFNPSMALQPYPWYYQIDEKWMGKSHFCLFTATQFSLQINTENAGVYTKNVGPGWVQIDLRGTLSSGDANPHNVQLSYRDDPVGVFI